MKIFSQNSAVKEILYLLKASLTNPNWVRQYREVMSHEKWSPEQIHDFNFKRRLKLLTFAYNHVSYYRNMYQEAGLEPGDVKSESDWGKIPMLTREALRFNYDSLKADNLIPGTYQMFTTGGSSGEPSKVLKDQRFAIKALKWRALKWADLRLGQDLATIMRTHPASWKQRLRLWAAWFPSKNIMLDAGEMTEENILSFIKEWKKVKPASSNSYVGGIHQLALYCQEKGIELPPPIAIFTTAAPLGNVTRKEIANAFRAPVYDSYVATEAHPMAGQCSCLVKAGSRALHIHNDYFHLEFVDDDGVPKFIGEEGDILVTDTGNFAMPIIRYRIGDRGRALEGVCGCGRPYQLMDAVQGRSFDFIYLEKGRIMGECWATAFDDCLMAIHNFQVHQHADKSVTLSVVINKDYPDAGNCVKRVADDLQRQLGNLPLNVEYKDFIPHVRGKIKYIISDLKEQEDDA
jgi:phenylacetate-CoA ligase